MLEEKKQLDGYEYWREALSYREDKTLSRPRMYEKTGLSLDFTSTGA